MKIIENKEDKIDPKEWIHALRSRDVEKIEELLKLDVDPYQEVSGQTSIFIARSLLADAQSDLVQNNYDRKRQRVSDCGVLNSCRVPSSFYKWLVTQTETMIVLLKKARPRLAGKMLLALTTGPWKFPKDIAKIIVKLRYDYKNEKVT